MRIISVGRDRNSPFAEAAQDYLKRLQRNYKVELVELSASRRKPAGVARREEAEAIKKRLGGGRLLVLDLAGKQLDSPALARRLSVWMQEARDVEFVVGGDEGLDPSLLARADEQLSLGLMTLPHRLARLVLLEQLYRAGTLLRGEPYHK